MKNTGMSIISTGLKDKNTYRNILLNIVPKWHGCILCHLAFTMKIRMQLRCAFRHKGVNTWQGDLTSFYEVAG